MWAYGITSLEPKGMYSHPTYSLPNPSRRMIEDSLAHNVSVGFCAQTGVDAVRSSLAQLENFKKLADRKNSGKIAENDLRHQI